MPKKIDTGPQTFDIYIKQNGRVHDPDTRKTLRKTSPGQVRWIAASGGPWKIVFPNGSPFASSTFDVAVGKPAVSDVPKATAKYTNYKYQVLDRSGKVVDDPDVIVES